MLSFNILLQSWPFALQGSNASMLMNNSCNVSSLTSPSSNQYRGQQGTHEIQNFHHAGHPNMSIRHNHESQLSYFWYLVRTERLKLLFLPTAKEHSVSEQKQPPFKIDHTKFMTIVNLIHIYFRVPYIILLFIDILIFKTDNMWSTF